MSAPPPAQQKPTEKPAVPKDEGESPPNPKGKYAEMTHEGKSPPNPKGNYAEMTHDAKIHVIRSYIDGKVPADAVREYGISPIAAGRAWNEYLSTYGDKIRIRPKPADAQVKPTESPPKPTGDEKPGEESAEKPPEMVIPKEKLLGRAMVPTISPENIGRLYTLAIARNIPDLDTFVMELIEWYGIRIDWEMKSGKRGMTIEEFREYLEDVTDAALKYMKLAQDGMNMMRGKEVVVGG